MISKTLKIFKATLRSLTKRLRSASPCATLHTDHKDRNEWVQITPKWEVTTKQSLCTRALLECLSRIRVQIISQEVTISTKQITTSAKSPNTVEQTVSKLLTRLIIFLAMTKQIKSKIFKSSSLSQDSEESRRITSKLKPVTNWPTEILTRQT